MLRLSYYSVVVFALMISCISYADDVGSKELLINQIHGWQGGKGEKANVPPKITILPKEIGGTRAVKATVIDNGPWQGISLKLENPVDINKYSSISFWIKQGFRIGKAAACVMMMKSPDKKILSIYHNFTSGTGDWTEITLPLNPYAWNQDGKRTKANFGVIDELIWYPYEAMSKPGQFIVISGVRFNPKNHSVRKIPVVGYRYVDSSGGGDSGNNLLTDGEVKKNAQAVWRPYETEPVICFDLGGVYLIKELQVDAVGVPARNISDIIVSVSNDKKIWTPVASIVNTETSGQEKHQILKKTDMLAVGRYVRLEVDRPRSDLPISLAEVTITGKTPTPEDLRAASESSYNIGPAMPKISNADYWKLEKGGISFWVNKKNGIICHLTRNGKLIAERIYIRYKVMTKKDTTASDSYNDKVLSHKMDGDILCLKIGNVKLPNLKIEKRLWIEDGSVTEQLNFIDADQKRPSIAEFSSEVVLNQDYRRNGIYENWSNGTANYLERIFAKDVNFNIGISREAALTFEKPDHKDTILHYRYKRNGRFFFLTSEMGCLAGDKSLYFNTTGWSMGLGLFQLHDHGKQSVTTHFSLTDGTLLKAYDEYLEQPEVKRFYTAIKRPEWLGCLRCGSGTALWDGILPPNTKLCMRPYPMLLREGYYPRFFNGLNFNLGEYLSEGIIRNNFGMKTTPEALRQRLVDIKKEIPGFKPMLYTWLCSANDSTQAYKKHPEWFADKDRNGHPAIFYPYFGNNYYRMASIKESQDDLFNMIHKMVNYYHNDGWYLDGGGVRGYLDYYNMRLDEPTGWLDLYWRLRKQLQKEDPDRVLFFNNAGNPQCDIGFLEGGVFENGSWRYCANWAWKIKAYQYRDPLHSPIYLYWKRQVESPYENYIAGLGMIPSFCSRDIAPREIPYLSALNEIRFLALAEASLSPDWRYDADTSLETITLRIGDGDDSGFVYLCSHAKDACKEYVSVNLAGFSLTDKNKPTYQWLFKIADARKWTGRLGEPELEKIYKTTSWRFERIITPTFLGTSELSNKISQIFDFEPERAYLWMLTQSPAVIFSVEGLPNQYWLPETLGVKVDGKISGDKITLQTESNRKVAEIMTLIPKGYCPVKTAVNGDDVSSRLFRWNDNLFAVVPVGNGKRDITVELVKTDAPTSAARFECPSTGQPGKEMTIKVELDKSWLGKPVLMSMKKAGVLNWFASKTVSMTSVEFKSVIPAAVEGGTYEVSVSDAGGRMVCSKTVTISDGKPQTVLPKVYVTPIIKDKVVNVPSDEQGPFNITQYGLQYSEGSCTAAVDPKSARVSVCTRPVIDRFFNTCAAGIEFKAKRYLKLRLTSNFSFFPKNGHFFQGHSIYSNTANHFIGLILDFHANKQYRSRSAVGLGAIKPKRNSRMPDKWGMRIPANNIYHLINYAYEENDDVTLWIDLKQLGAPADWDGRIWLTAMFEHIHPDRKMNVEILGMADILPAGAKVIKGKDMLEAYRIKKEYEVPSIKENVKIEGKLEEPMWKKAVKVSGLTILRKPGCPAPQETNCYIFHDDKNLYMGFEIYEREAENFQYITDQNVCQNDSVEFCLKGSMNDKYFLQGLISFQGQVDSYRHFTNHKKAEKIAFFGEVAVTRGENVFYAEIAVPLELLGITGNPSGKEITFNIMRNRYVGGTSQFSTLVPGDSYFDTKRFYKLKLK